MDTGIEKCMDLAATHLQLAAEHKTDCRCHNCQCWWGLTVIWFRSAAIMMEAGG